MPIDATAVQNLPNVLCIDKCTPFGSQLAVLIALACQWGGLNPNPAVLQANAACFQKCIPPGMRMGVLISLSEQIQAGSPGTTPIGDPCVYTPVNTELKTFNGIICALPPPVCSRATRLPVARALDTLVTSLKIAGVWASLDALYPFVGGTAASCALNLVNPILYDITWHGGVTFPAGGGFLSDGSTGYGDTGFNPNSAGGNYSQNSATLGASVGAQLATQWPMGCIDAAIYSGLQFDGTGNVYITVNSGLSLTSLHVGSGAGIAVESRNSATNIYALGANGNSGNFNIASTGIPNRNIFVGGVNSSGTPAGFFPYPIYLAFIGGGFSSTQIAAIAAAANTYANTPGVPGCP
jgi:hypothetical protein